MRFAKVSLGALIVLAGVASSVAQADVKSELQARYDTMAKAIKGRNVKAVMAMLTPDFVNEGQGQKQDRKVFEQTITQLVTQAKSFDILSFRADKVTSSGKSATVLTQSHMKIVMVDKDGAMGAKGASHTMELKGSDRETWVKQGSTWLLRKSVSIPGAKMTLDGKPIGGPR